VFESLANSVAAAALTANPQVIEQQAVEQQAIEQQVALVPDVFPQIGEKGTKLAKVALASDTSANPVTTKSFLKTAPGEPAQQLYQTGPVLDAAAVQETPGQLQAQQFDRPSSTPGKTRTEVVEEKIESSTAFLIKRVEITGNTTFTAAELSTYTKSLEGKTVTLAELRAAVDNITKFYLSKGYVNSRAFLGNQEVVDGLVKIQILEGTVEDIKVEGNKRVTSAYVIDRIKAGVGTPLRADVLEDRLRLLQLDSAFEKVEASLSPGSGPGKSLLTVRVKEAKSAFFGLTSDNYSPPVVGSERYGAFVGFRGLLKAGDEFFGSYNRTTSGGSDALDFLYRTPINANNGTVQLRIAPSWNKITDKEIGSIFDITGNSQLYDLTYRQPIKRTFKEELAFSIGFALQNGETNVGGTNLFNTNNRVRVLKFGQDYLNRDAQGVWSARSSFNLGLDVFNATKNPGDLADGKFFSWTGQLQRVQRFNANNLVIAQLDLQLSPDPLLPSQQFVIGGGQSVRGFRQNARFGDNGTRFSLEGRTVVSRNAEGTAVVQVAPFIDLGSVWNVSRNPVGTSSQNFLSGAGVGLILQPIKGLNMRFDYALPFLKATEKNKNLQDKAFYFSLSYQP
jgi:hemolysin activation/secretion protein